MATRNLEMRALIPASYQPQSLNQIYWFTMYFKASSAAAQSTSKVLLSKTILDST